MPNMGKYKPNNAYEYKNTYYDEKSSDHGHYEPEVTGRRYGKDGSQAKITQMRWVEDNRDFSPESSAPTPETAPPEPASSDISPEIEYSPEIQKAQQFVNRFEQGFSPYNDLTSQNFLDSYKQGFDKRNSTAVKSVTDNNMFADTTSNPVNKADEAAQNFLTDKKKLILG